MTEAVHSAHDGIIITDREGRIEWANPAFTEMTGYTLSEAAGRTPGDLIQSGEHDEGFYEELWETILAGEVWTGRIVNRRKDGTLYPEQQTITPVRDASGEISHFIGIKQDVSEQVAAEKQLRRTNRALRVISAANQALVWSLSEDEILDRMCRIAVEVGEYRFAWIGYLEEDDPTRLRPVAQYGDGGDYLESVGVDPGLAVSGASDGPIGQAVNAGTPAVVHEMEWVEDEDSWEREAFGQGFRSKIAIPLVTEGGCLGALSIYSDEPDAFDEREIEILAEVGTDLAYGIATHRTRQREAKLENQLRQSEKLRALGQLAGGVAHDFNNYLTVITGLTDMVLHDPDLSREIREDLREIQDAAGSSARLTQQLLAFSRQQDAEPEALDLREVIRHMGSILHRLLNDSTQVDLRVGEAPLPVHADPGQLEQLMMNLAVNAQEAMPEGGTLTVEPSAVQVTDASTERYEGLEPGPYVGLEIRDTGTGIREEDLSHLFEPFFTTKEGGTGLGLSTVYGIVKQVGGDIRVESEVGEGTCFKIYLPRRDDEESSESESDAGSEEVEQDL